MIFKNHPFLNIYNFDYNRANSFFNLKNIKKVGIEIKLDSSGNVVNISNGSGGEVTLEDGSKKTIINGKRYDKDSYVKASGSYNNSIINGAGINKGALVIEGGLKMISQL